MSNQDDFHTEELAPKREPMFNIPVTILGFSVILIGIHGVREFILPYASQLDFLLRFAFVPARYVVDGSQLPLFGTSRYFSPITYAFLHGNWEHLIVNLLWLVAFGSAVARRFGAIRFTLFSLLAAVAGAALHFAVFPKDIVPMVGASAVVSAYMGAACRFAFVPGRMGAGNEAFNKPALSLIGSFKNPASLIFIAVWFVMNYLFGSGLVSVVGEGASIAWQAHIGGFLFGLLAFRLFDGR